MGIIEDCRALSDADLARDLEFMAQRDRHCLGKMLAHLAEYDRRQLCVARSGGSLFSFCVRTLGYDEFDAYRRIRAARTLAKFPAALELIGRGRLSLSAIAVLHPYLTPENHREWFALAAKRSRREIEALIAARFPQGARQDYHRRYPAPPVALAPAAPPQAVDVLPSAPASGDSAAAGAPAAPPAPGAPPRPHEWQAMVPIGAERVRIGFDAALAVMRLIERARQVLRHKYPAGRLEDVVKEALEALLDRRDPQRRLGFKPATLVGDGAATPERGRPGAAPGEPRFLRALRAGRYVPARVKREVWRRDDGRCAWRFGDGTPCGSRDGLEYDHVRPYARGGRSDDPRNVRLLCRAHNRLAAERAGLALVSGRGGGAA
jgi:HNH endonuclease